jgi:hypothetical protein
VLYWTINQEVKILVRVEFAWQPQGALVDTRINEVQSGIHTRSLSSTVNVCSFGKEESKATARNLHLVFLV